MASMKVCNKFIPVCNTSIQKICLKKFPFKLLLRNLVKRKGEINTGFCDYRGLPCALNPEEVSILSKNSLHPLHREEHLYGNSQTALFIYVLGLISIHMTRRINLNHETRSQSNDLRVDSSWSSIQTEQRSIYDENVTNKKKYRGENQECDKHYIFLSHPTSFITFICLVLIAGLSHIFSFNFRYTFQILWSIY